MYSYAALAMVVILAFTGAPTTVAAIPSPKRGLADTHVYACKNFAAAGDNLTWTYGWGPSTNCTEFIEDKLFVPMLWGKWSIGNFDRNTTYRNIPALLGFNEPNHKEQSNMSPLEAASLWSEVESIATLVNATLLGSPAAAPCGGGPTKCNGGDAVPWFTAFFGNCTNCRVDFLATHFYGCTLKGLKEYLDSLKVFGLPIWLTEFNCGGGWNDFPVSKQKKWMEQSLPFLDSNPHVHRYSWMAGHAKNDPNADLFTWVDGVAMPTELGDVYLSLHSQQ